MKPIVFLTSGTLGDVQPTTALARGMQDAGHVVRVAAPPAFRKLIEAQSLPFAALEGNPSDLLTEPGRQSALTFDNNPLVGIKSTLGYLRAARPVYAQMIGNGWRVSQGASALVIGLPTIWATSIAEALEIPHIGAFLQPVTSTEEFPSPLLPSALRLGRAYNKFTYWLTTLAVYLPWRGAINRWRRHSLGLKPLQVFHQSFEKMDAILYGFSEKVVPCPKDWPGNQVVTGYWSLKAESFTPPPELQHFIQSGKPPFYFGFGSPGMFEPRRLTELLIRSIEKAGIRAVLSLPGHINLQTQNEKIFIQRRNVPHDWLFPRMAGVVHHGGAGTTAAALMAGVPTFIAPLAVDQFFWGERVHALGVGPRAVPQRALTEEKLEDALNEMKGWRVKEAAQKLGEQLRRENGVLEAVRVMESILETGPDLGRRPERNGGERRIS